MSALWSPYSLLGSSLEFLPHPVSDICVLPPALTSVRLTPGDPVGFMVSPGDRSPFADTRCCIAAAHVHPFPGGSPTTSPVLFTFSRGGEQAQTAAATPSDALRSGRALEGSSAAAVSDSRSDLPASLNNLIASAILSPMFSSATPPFSA